jgi:hypothetical protein
MGWAFRRRIDGLFSSTCDVALRSSPTELQNLLVVNHVPGDDGVDRRDVDDRAGSDITLAQFHNPKLGPFEVKPGAF